RRQGMVDLLDPGPVPRGGYAIPERDLIPDCVVGDHAVAPWSSTDLSLVHLLSRPQHTTWVRARLPGEGLAGAVCEHHGELLSAPQGVYAIEGGRPAPHDRRGTRGLCEASGASEVGEARQTSLADEGPDARAQHH